MERYNPPSPPHLSTIRVEACRGSFNTISDELLTEREMLEKQTSPSSKQDGRPELRPGHGPSAHRTQPTLNGPVPGAEMGDLKNEHFGAS
jgi:hypothetical protein